MSRTKVTVPGMNLQRRLLNWLATGSPSSQSLRRICQDRQSDRPIRCCLQTVSITSGSACRPGRTGCSDSCGHCQRGLQRLPGFSIPFRLSLESRVHVPLASDAMWPGMRYLKQTRFLCKRRDFTILRFRRALHVRLRCNAERARSGV